MDGWAGVIGGKPTVGVAAERSRQVGLREIELFTAMTGDANPLHTDPALAQASRFGGLIVQGGVTTGVLNAVVAEDLPGPGSVFLSVSWRFERPVHVDDEITGRVEVASVREDKPICEVTTSVTNQRGEVCLSGTAVVYTAALAPPPSEPGVAAQPA